MVKVSIIVPVHNAQSYLNKCVDSLLAQTLEDIEIILVDDASADGSRGLMMAYQAQCPDKIVTICMDENIRQGGARNRAMKVAQGEYLAFVDSDDWVEPDMCQVLYEAANGADMVGADYFIDTAQSVESVHLSYDSTQVFGAEQKVHYMTRCGLFWSRIYRRDFLLENDLFFPEKTFYEDAWFNFMTALYADRIVKVSGTFYHYYQSENSTMRSRNTTRQYERLEIPRRIIRDCRLRGIYEKYKELVDYKYISMQLSNIRNTCLAQFDRPEPERLRQICRAIREDCPRYRKCPYYKKTSRLQRDYLRLAKLSPKLTVWLYTHGADPKIELWGVLMGKLSRRK